MKTINMLSAAAALVVVGCGFAIPAKAFPPTATVSPGYDRALAESRRQRSAGQPYVVAPNARGYYAERPSPRIKRRYRRY